MVLKQLVFFLILGAYRNLHFTDSYNARIPLCLICLLLGNLNEGSFLLHGLTLLYHK